MKDDSKLKRVCVSRLEYGLAGFASANIDNFGYYPEALWKNRSFKFLVACELGGVGAALFDIMQVTIV